MQVQLYSHFGEDSVQLVIERHQASGKTADNLCSESLVELEAVCKPGATEPAKDPGRNGDQDKQGQHDHPLFCLVNKQAKAANQQEMRRALFLCSFTIPFTFAGQDKDIFDSRMGLRNQNPSTCKEQMVKGTVPGAVTVSLILSVSVMGIEMQALAINDC
ncbi:hypothetical protein Anapl_13715 [Anas platyrhynchos]|uniref:Uncharacterized protein n=1 Tax=Anas platyrhynchos TaxID=8839 RepID=R0LL29_ANAPL|nr:hypothetical protein Anapl_13715 [Anas platyrhynchos]